MFLVPPNGRKLKWNLRFRNHDGKIVTVSGDREEETARRLGDRVDMLLRSKQNGDPPPNQIQTWIDNMPPKLAERLHGLGLLDRRRIEQRVPLVEQIDKFQKVVANRKTNSAEHAKIQANRVRRIVKEIKATSFADINEDDVSDAVGSWSLSVASRHHYLVAMKDFTKWAHRTGRTSSNPLVNLKPPGQFADPEVERVPLKVAQFQDLMQYLDSFEYYKWQRASWSAHDRKMIYWTAVKTGYRKGELRSLRVKQLRLDSTPPCIVIKAKDAKNKNADGVPIPDDLAVELKSYVEGKEANDKIFHFAVESRSVVNAFRRDLEGAKIQWDFGDDSPETVDFHTLRSTAICWWLDEDGLSSKRVQILARLKTLRLVDAYSRNLRLDDFGWLNKSAKLSEPNDQRQAG